MRDAQHYGLPPIYDTDPWRAPRWWRWAATLLLLAILLTTVGRVVTVLGPSSGSPWFCWSENGVQKCGLRLPDGIVTVDQA